MDNCIFCKVVSGIIPSNKEYEDEFVVVFHDIHPQAPVHLLVVPKKHIDSFNSVDNETMGHITDAIKNVTIKMGLDKMGYRVINNCGTSAGQTVFHIHFHILGGKKLSWGNMEEDTHKSI
jgi:histidine triad (HIT) family protein